MKKKKYLILLLAVVILIPLWRLSVIFKNKQNANKQTIVWQPETVDVNTLIPPDQVNYKIQKSIIDFNGQKLILVFTFLEDKYLNYAHILLIGPDNKGKAILKSDLDLKNDVLSLGIVDMPSLSEQKDINGDGIPELVVNLASGGAYTENFGIFEIKDNQINWTYLKDRDNKQKPAIFSEGSSVMHSQAYMINADKKALIQFSGETPDGETWKWVAEAYVWNGTIFVYDQTLSDELTKLGPG